MEIHYDRCVLTHTLLRNFHMDRLTKIKFKDEVDHALFNLSVSYLDFLDETIKIYEEKRFTLCNYSCRMLIEIFFIMNALMKDSTVLEKLKNKQDRETIKIKRELIKYSEHKETVMEHIQELRDRIDSRSTKATLNFKELSNYVDDRSGLNSLQLYSIYRLLSKDTHISIFSEPLKRITPEGSYSIKTTKENTTGITNMLHCAYVSIALVEVLIPYFQSKYKIE